jgi:outer membrane biosynthesis protein TonB
MRLWINSYAHPTAFTPSAALSVAAHVVFLGSAVYASGPRTPVTEREELTEQVFFLPPPDRAKSSETLVERLRFVDVGAGASAQGDASVYKGTAGESRPSGAKQAGSAVGADDATQAAQTTVEAFDSVYSILNVEESAVRVEGSAAPIYPPELIERKIEGGVPTRYVIDTTGRADLSTLEILAPAHPLFVQSVRDALPDMRFQPASVAGHKVRQMVEQRFEFRLLLPPMTVPAEHTRANPIP